MNNKYQSGDFCEYILCSNNSSRKAGNKDACVNCNAFLFHEYLKKEGFKIQKEPDLTLNNYQKQAYKTMLPQCENHNYLALVLAGEMGELCDKLKRVIRGDGKIDNGIVEEIGDVLWYLSQLSQLLKIDLETVAKRNLQKLK